MGDLTTTTPLFDPAGGSGEGFAALILELMGQGVTVTDAAGRFVYVNPAYARLFGYEPAALIGRSPIELTASEAQESLKAQRTLRIEGRKTSYESLLVCADGRIAPVLINGVPRAEPGEPYEGAIAVITDMSEQKAIQEELRRSLQENRTLLSELQHRVKNTFAMIAGLVALSREADCSLRDNRTLDELDSRIRSISELYALLYESRSFAELRLDEYLRRVTAGLASLAGAIRIDAEFEPILAPVDAAVPIGLILTELATNAVKHAFPDGRDGTITIRLAKKDGGAVLELRDDGVGLSGSNGEHGMGTELIQGLASQIRARIQRAEASPGLRFTLDLPLPLA